jgi:hypothetical protein
MSVAHRERLLMLALTSLLGACHRGQASLRIGDQVSPPPGLDSIATARWVDAQRAACPGVLKFQVDPGFARDLDGVARYHSWLAGVQCVRP